MARDEEAYFRAKKKINEARRSATTELWLSKAGLTDLPSSVGELSQLRLLQLSNNRLTSLPDSIGNLSMLEELIVEHNQLKIPSVTIMMRHSYPIV